MLAEFKLRVRKGFLNFRYRQVSDVALTDDLKLRINNPNLPSLTKEERDQVKALWGFLPDAIFKKGLVYYRLTKLLRSFNERYVPASYYVPYICFILNPRNYIGCFVNKSLYDLHFSDINRPITIVESIGGIFYDGSNCQMTQEKAIETVSSWFESHPQQLIFKRSTESSGGKGISFISPCPIEELQKIFSEYDDDFIVQKICRQHYSTNIFNSECLNSFRITTLNLNGRTSILSRVFKIGAKGLKVDNSGAGGIMVGVDDKGVLDDKGFLANGDVVEEFNGLQLKGHTIEGYEQIDRMALSLHSRFDHLHIIGWDIALDETGAPLLIEANATWPGITVEQLCTGPIFGDRTEEVIEYCKNRTDLLPNRIFNF